MRFKLVLLVMMTIITGVRAANKTVVRFDRRKVIERDETWAGNYEIMDGILVAKGRTLTLKPGVRITFIKTDKINDLDIRGRLLALGTAKDPIIITSNVKYPGSWQGISIFSEDKRTPGRDLSRFAHTRFSYAGTAIKLERSAATLENCEFLKSNLGMELILESDVKVKDSAFSNIREAAVKIERGGIADLSGCDFSFNKIGITGSGDYHLTITGSKFSDNDQAVYYSNLNPDTVITKNKFNKNLYGIQINRRTEGEISRNSFSGNTYGVFVANQSRPDITRNLFTDNTRAITCSRMATPRIRQNEIYNNVIAIECLLGSYPKVEYNNIYQNQTALFLRFLSSDWDIVNGVSDQPLVFDASKNWWGEKTTRILEEKGSEYNRPDIFDGYDTPYNQNRGLVFNKQKVSYDKWLTSQVEDTYGQENE